PQPLAAHRDRTDALRNGDTHQRRFLAEDSCLALYLRRADLDRWRFDLGGLCSDESSNRGHRRLTEGISHADSNWTETFADIPAATGTALGLPSPRREFPAGVDPGRGASARR